MKSILLLIALAISLPTIASEQYTMENIEYKDEKYEANLSFPIILQKATLDIAAAKINQNFINHLATASCTPEDAKGSTLNLYYDASAEIVDINNNYVSYKVTYDDFCGGMHPNNGTYYKTYNSVTGEEISMNEAVPAQNFDKDDFDWQQLEAYQAELAELMLQNLDKNSAVYKDCYSEESDMPMLIADFFPTIAGLGKNQTIILKTSPPHVASICEFSVEVPYSAVEKYFSSDSIVKEWMK